MSVDQGKPSSYIPPQPVNPGPSRLLIAGGAAIAVLVVLIVILFALNLFRSPAATPGAPTASPGASAHGSPTPTSAGSPNGSSAPSVAPPTIAPGATPTPGSSVVAPSAGTPEAQLLAHVPEAIRATCTTSAGDGSVLISASCTADSGTINVIYDQYGDATSMDADYEDVFAREHIDADSGACEDHGTWPADGSYQIENEPAGRRLCTDRPGAPTIYWTDDRLTILSTASSPSGDAAALVQFWANEAGPIQ